MLRFIDGNDSGVTYVTCHTVRNVYYFDGCQHRNRNAQQMEEVMNEAVEIGGDYVCKFHGSNLEACDLMIDHRSDKET